MNYKEALDFLYGSLPMYQRVGQAAYKADLETSLELDRYFKHPHRHFPIIHVAGTNGKGSVSHMLAAILMEKGYTTGLYTSPHLLDFRERIRINGEMISENQVVDFLQQHRQIIERLLPSFFEMTVALAFEYFSRQKVDVAVVETGMGGRLDSTNIAGPELSIITNISMDHTQFLGNSIPAIAKEKGGIIKAGVPVVLGKMHEEARKELVKIADERGSPCRLTEELFSPLFSTATPQGSTLCRVMDKEKGVSGEYNLDLNGFYQQENLHTVLAAVKELNQGGWDLDPGSVGRGLARTSETTGLLGRWQTLGSNPRSICDTAHNPEGIRVVVEQIRQTPWKKLHMVWGMSSDKDPASILPILPLEAFYYFTPSSVPRSMDAKILEQHARDLGLEGMVCNGVSGAYEAAINAAGPNDMVFTGGSTFVVADLLRSLGY